MAQERENYCYLLGLNPYREDRYSKGEIVKRIDEAEEKWRKEAQATSGSLKRKYRANTYLSMVTDMYAVIESNVLLEDEFENGRTLLESKASKLNKDVIVLHDGSSYLIPGAENELAKRLKWADVDGPTVLRASKIQPVPAPKPVDDDIMTAFEKLSDVGLYTSKELLNTLIELPSMNMDINRLDPGCRPEEVRDAFGAVERRLSVMKAGNIENQDAYIQAMRALKVVMYPDDRLAMLDRYGRCMRAMEPAIESMEEDYGQPFTSNYLHGLISIYGSHEAIDNEMAVAILEAYCCKRHFIANFSSKNTRLTICPSCKAMVADGKDTVFCPVCGKAMRIVCPHCGTTQPSTYRSCIKCGFGFEEGFREVRRERQAIMDLLAEGDVGGAEDRFGSMQERFPEFTENNDLLVRIGKASSDYRRALGRIDNDYRIRNLYDLKTTVESARIQFPRIMEADYVAERYSEACEKVQEADTLCSLAADSEGEDTMDLYIRAADKCPDHPNAVRRLRDYPPEGPADAVCQVRKDTVLLRYAVPSDRKGVSFCIYRGRNTLPEVDQSTVPLAEIPGGVFLDKTLDPGVDYYYKIHSKRWGILSRDFAQCGPAMVLSEVEGVKVETIEDGLRITYPTPRGCSRVRIWRKEEGDAGQEEVEIVHGNTGTVEDRSLKGETVYHYLFVAEYDVNGRTERSLGTVFSGKTSRYPEPVNDMEVSWNRTDGSYSARWSSTEKVVLYASPRKARIFGTAVPVEDVERWMSPVEPDEVYDNGCKFDLPDGAVIFLYPMVRIGRTAIRGREVMITNLRPFRDVEKKMDGGDCDITVTWPEGAESAIVVVSDPGAREDQPRSEKITVSRELYEKDGRIRIQMGMSNKKTVTLLAVYDVEGTKAESIPFTMDVYSGSSTKVRYSVREERVKEDRNLTRIVMDLECAEGDSIPRLAMTATNVGIPLRMNDGEVVWDSQDPIALQDGRAQTWFTMDKGKADLKRMRLFFVNKEEYSLYKLIHPLYREV